MKKLLLTLALILTTIAAGAQELSFIYNDETQTASLTYAVDPTTHQRVAYPSSLREIPAKAPNGYRVTAIGEYALADCLTNQLTIPASVVDVYDNAFCNMCYLRKITFADGDEPLFLGITNANPEGGIFSGCTALMEIYIGRNLTYDTENFLPLSGGDFSPARSLTGATFGEKVKSIPCRLFANCTKLQNVSFGSHVTTIEKEAFMNCTALQSLKQFPSVTTIKEGAFASCRQLTSISMPSSLKEIGKHAFSDSGIEMLTIPAGMMTIGDDALVNMHNLNTLIFEDSDYPLSISTAASDGPFDGNTAMKEIYIGRNITYDENGILPLSGGSNPPSQSLLRATISDYVTSIPYGLFRNCEKLSTVNFGINIREIGASAFENCESIVSLILPMAIQILKEKTFMNCHNLRGIQLPKALTQIGDWVLGNCYQLETLNIPGNVKNISYYAFAGSGLKRLTIADGKGSCLMGNDPGMESGMFRYISNLEYFYMGKNLTFMNGVSPFMSSACPTKEIVVGPEVTKIESSMFVGGADNAQTVSLGSGLQTIGKNNFSGCTLLSELTCNASEPPVCEDNTVFAEVDKANCKLYVPDDIVMEAYKEAPIWKEFFTIEPLTAIQGVTVDQSSTGVWYDLNGRRVDSNTARKGLYISNGRVFVNK